MTSNHDSWAPDVLEVELVDQEVHHLRDHLLQDQEVHRWSAPSLLFSLLRAPLLSCFLCALQASPQICFFPFFSFLSFFLFFGA